MQALELLKLLYLASPSLPVGAYAYSQGLESAVENMWLDNDDKICAWVLGVLENSIASTDLPVLSRCYDAWLANDLAAINHWNTFLIASRETKEFLLEDSQLGIGLARVLETHNITKHQGTIDDPISFPVLFALAGTEWSIDKKELSHAFAWSWLENQIAAATKTIPLGQTQAQRILMRILEALPKILVSAEQIREDAIGAGLPGLALASCLHERQYSRLFRS